MLMAMVLHNLNSRPVDVQYYKLFVLYAILDDVQALYMFLTMTGWCVSLFLAKSTVPTTLFYC